MSLIMDAPVKVEFDNEKLHIQRGDIWFAHLPPSGGSIQRGSRPFLIIQNNIGNTFAPTIWGAAITSQISKAQLPTHVHLDASTYGLERDSIILLEQPRSLDKFSLDHIITKLDKEKMKEVDRALLISAGLQEYLKYIV